MNRFFIAILLTNWIVLAYGQGAVQASFVPVASGYAQTSVNATIFRKNSISSQDGHQVVAFYNQLGRVVLAHRELGEEDWDIRTTRFEGNVADAHNIISILHDGDGYLHMAWDHHGDSLHYARSVAPHSLKMEEVTMIGRAEGKVTYPEFYRLPDGNLIFAYRDGQSGNGNLVLNLYATEHKTWTRLHDNLIDGEGERNAYWQMCVDQAGTIHLSWVWREGWDVASNHDLCYVRSFDGGKSWVTYQGEPCSLPMTDETPAYVFRIPPNSSLINQTSITADAAGNPFIATYFRGEADEVTQFKLVYLWENSWRAATVSKRKTAFDLGGGGTKSLPISRPQVMVDTDHAYLIYRDEEYDNRLCLATASLSDMDKWNIRSLNEESMDRWEPSYDTYLWQEKGLLHLYYQVTGQGDGERTTASPPTTVQVLELEWD